MSQCLICFDDETSKDPLIAPCNRCRMRAHSKCITNYISRHLISLRLYVERLSPYQIYGYSLSDGLYVSKTDLPICKIPFSRVFRKTNYGRYLGLKEKHIELPSYNPRTLLAIQIDNYTSDEIVLLDDCPQCKNLIILKSEKRQLLHFLAIPTSTNLMVAQIIESIEHFLSLQSKWSLFMSFLSSLTCSVAPAFPWGYLFRNYNLEINDIIAISYLSIKTILPFQYYLVCLGSFTSTYYMPFQSFLVPYFLLTRCLSNIFYCLVVNRIYMHFSLKVYPDKTRSVLQFFKVNKIDEMDRFRRWFVLLNFDFKTMFKPMWSANEEPFYPSYFNFGEGKRLFCSVTSPFDSVLQIAGGWLFGHKILGGFKSIVKTSYLFLKHFKPAPIDMDAFLEFCGIQIVNAIVEICDLLYIYYNIKTVTTLFVPLPESQEYNFEQNMEEIS